MESGKAAAAAAVGGVLGTLPLVLTDSAPLLAKALTFGSSVATCVLFGVVYRYAIAADRSNTQLKAGAVAAFGLTRGLALAESSLKGVAVIDGDAVATAALAAGQSMLVIGFAVVALEYAMQQEMVKGFGEATFKMEE